MPLFPFGALAALLLIILCCSSSYAAAARLLPAAPTAARLSAAVLIAWWLLVVVFYALMAVGAFALPAALAVWAALAAAALRGAESRLRVRGLARLDRQRATAALRCAWGRSTALPVAAAAVIGTLDLARGLVAPPLGWDALTYHLVHAARWVQHGGFVSRPAPDAGRYYEYFPYGGEILWSWAMLPTHDDALLVGAESLVVLTIGLALYAAVRAVGVRVTRAVLVAVTIVATPAVLAFTNSAYVDNTATACFALTVLFLARAATDPQLPDLALCAAAAGLGAAVKSSGLPLFALTVAALAVASRRCRPAPAALLRLVTVATLGALPVVLQALYTWSATGSPLYPFSLDLFGWRVFAGNAQLEQLMSGALFVGTPLAATRWQLAVALFLPAVDGRPHLNFGPGGIAVLGLGIAGLLRLWQRRSTRVLAAFLAASAVTSVALLLSPHAAGLLAWKEVAGRLIAPALVALGVAAATVLPAARADRLWQALALLALWLSRPRGISTADAVAMAGVLALIAVAAVGVVVAVRRSGQGRRPSWAAAAAVAGVLLVAAGVATARPAVRSRVYDGVASGASPLNPVYAASAVIWKGLATLPPQRIAVASGWDGIGHNAYLYPLFGARLQHEILYVPPTCSGEILDYQRHAALLAAADLDCWLRHLLDADVDLVVTLAPPKTPERAWVDAHPGLFEPVVEGQGGASRAVRVRRDAVRRFLADTQTVPADSAHQPPVE